MKIAPRSFFLFFVIVSVLALNACGPTAAPAKAGRPASGISGVSNGPSAVEFTGTVESISASQIVVNGQTIAVDSSTALGGSFQPGDNVQVSANVQPDGSILASRIKPAGAQPALAAGATPASPADAGIEFTGTVEVISADSITISGQTFPIGPETEINGNIVVGDTVTVHYTTNADGTLSVSEINLEGFVDPSETPDPNSTDIATQEITGVVDSFDGSVLVVAGQTFNVDASTELDSGIAPGVTVKVEYYVDANNNNVATDVSLESTVTDGGTSSGSNNNSGGNNSGNGNSGGSDDDGGDTGGDEDNGGGSDDGSVLIIDRSSID